MRLVALAFLSIAALACSASAPSGLPSDGGGGTGALTGSGGGSTGTSGGSSEIYPLKVGYAWTYDVTLTGAYGCVPNPVSTVTGTAMVAGRETYETTYFCDPSTVWHLNKTSDGGVDIYWDDTGWITEAGGTLQEGYTWQSRFSTMTWHDEGTVTVPAGTFDGCWREVQNVSYTSWTVYCPGVGPIHSYMSDLNGGGIDAVLISKSF